MIACSGCGYALAEGRETFGAVNGPVFCSDCYSEWLELQPERERLERDRAQTVREMEACLQEMKGAEQLGNDGDRLRAEIAFDCGSEYVQDIDNELDCLTVAYQRRFSVIGRATA